MLELVVASADPLQDLAPVNNSKLLSFHQAHILLSLRGLLYHLGSIILGSGVTNLLSSHICSCVT